MRGLYQGDTPWRVPTKTLTYMNPLNYTVTDRFLRYVKIDTQSDPNSTTIPSTLKQKDLGELLVKELHEIGIKNALLIRLCSD